MSIQVNEENLVFHLRTSKTSYIMAVAKGKYLCHVYWGDRLNKEPDLNNGLILRNICFSANTENEDKSYSLDYACQEYPTGCNTDFRIPAISMEFNDGSRVLELKYDGYELIKGKQKLTGLPATYVEEIGRAHV